MTLLVGLIAGGGAVGGFWWINRPDYLIDSARKAFAKGEEAHNRGEDALAKDLYQKADKQLDKLLDKDKLPNTPEGQQMRAEGQLLKCKVLDKLAVVEDKEEKAAGNNDAKRPSALHASAAKELAIRTAARNPTLFEAQAIAQQKHFDEFSSGGGDDKRSLTNAVAFADNILKATSDQIPADFPNVYELKQGAHYVLALNAADQKRPDEILAHTKASAELQAQNTKEKELRWRVYSLEPMALKLKYEEAKGFANRPGNRPGKAEEMKKVAELEGELRSKIQDGLDRVRREKEEKVQENGAELPKLAKLHPSDVNGLFDFLRLSVEASADREEVVNRSNLFTEVGKLLTEKGVPPAVARQTIRQIAKLPETLTTLAKQDAKLQPREADWESIRQAVADISAKGDARAFVLKPEDYYRMMMTARSEGKLDEAIKYAKDGLEAADKQPNTADKGFVAGLQAELAWLYLVLHKPQEAEPHLLALRKTGKLSGLVNLIEGMGARQNDRLEVAVKFLKEAEKDEEVKKKHRPLLNMYLGYCYMGLGKFADAIAYLERVESLFRDPEKLSKDEKDLVADMLSNQNELYLKLLYCHLALGHLDKGLEYKEKLKNAPEGKTADILLIKAMSVAAAKLQADGNTEGADKLRADARKRLEAAKKEHGQLPGLLEAEFQMILSEPITPTSPGLFFGSSLNVDALMRLARAERFLHDAAFDPKKKDVASMVLWVHLLENTGRMEQAADVLTKLEKEDLSAEQKKLVLLEETNLRLRMRDMGEVGRLVDLLGEGKEKDQAELIRAMASGEYEKALKLTTDATNKQETNAAMHFARGQIFLQQNKFSDAVWAFERAMQYTNFKRASEDGLYRSLVRLAEKDPNLAEKEAEKVRKSHPDNLAVMLAIAKIAQYQDNIFGKTGMEGAMAEVRNILARQDPKNPMGPYLTAVQWSSAGRPDLARKEIEAALKTTNEKHVPSLLLACQLAAADEDWDSLQAYVDALDEVQKNRPEVPVWRAAVLVNQGKPEKAKALFEKLKQENPNLATGYLGLADLYERDKKYEQALAEIRAWKAKQPEDPALLSVGEIRLLALCGKVDEAEKLGRDFWTKQRSKLTKDFEEADKKNPPKEDKKEELAKIRQDTLLTAEANIQILVANGLRDARLFEKSRAWLADALATVNKLSNETNRKDSVRGVELLQAESYLTQGSLLKKDDKARAPLMDEARRLYEKIYKEAPGNALAANNLAWMLNERGEAKAAMDIADKLRLGRLSQKPIDGSRMHVELLDTLGVVYRANKQDEKVLDLFKDAMKRYEKEPRIYLHMGRAYADLKQKNEAYENLSKGIRLAQAKLEKTTDPERKTKLEEMIEEAQKDRDKIK
jgi:tetratricopeptide (TPR) repeat protein